MTNAAAETGKMKKVLVVDDSETIRQHVAEALTNVGFQVFEASDGMAGLERVSQHDFAMIILDVNMPLLNGLEMLERLKQDGKTARIPVLMLTTEAQRSMVERARLAGAKAWLIKPVKVDSLISTVNKVLQQQAVG
jgi:two-component system chemotaxis response regulator CheY